MSPPHPFRLESPCLGPPLQAGMDRQVKKVEDLGVFRPPGASSPGISFSPFLSVPGA